MREIKGDLFAQVGTLVIPTNGIYDAMGRAVMGAGVALAAREKFFELDLRLAWKLIEQGNHCFYFPEHKVMTFPTKNHWQNPSFPDRIWRSALGARALADKENLTELFLPKVGCGYGGLSWDTVYPILRDTLDDRFCVVLE